MLYEERVEVDPGTRVGIRIAVHHESQADGIHDPHDQMKLGGWLSRLELVDPLAGHASATSQLALT